MTSRWRIAVPVIILVLLPELALLGAGWYFSGEIKSGAFVVDHSDPKLDLKVVSVGQERITLETTLDTSNAGRWKADGIWGLEWDDGYGQVGSIIALDEERAEREFIQIEGSPDVGQMVRIDSYTFPGDPQQGMGIPFEDVQLTSPLGAFPAWLVQGGPSDTWVIFVHGRGATRAEALRIVPTMVDAGHTSLIVTYRNDEGVPASPDGLYRFGQTEWEDVEAASRYALDSGAADIVLVGYSMGGGIILSFLYRSQLAERVSAVILDSPVVDLSAVVDFRARQRDLPVIGLPIPGILTAIAKYISSVRFGVDYGELDFIRRADKLSVPILLFHGDDDISVPVETSDEFAESRPDLVRYVRVNGATHVGSWNADPQAYTSEVRNFLAQFVR